MLCPGSDMDCDNPGCRRGGCQGRAPERPLLKLMSVAGSTAVQPEDLAHGGRSDAVYAIVQAPSAPVRAPLQAKATPRALAALVDT